MNPLALKPYRSVLGEGFYEFEEKRSRFIARVKPVETEAEATAFIQSVRALGREATHHCYAYALQGESAYQRHSDDGEPSGTAGIPILEVIRKKDLVNVTVVVTRYFGGILLGAGGLVRAYGKAASGGIENAGELLAKPCLEAVAHLEYTMLGRVRSMLTTEGFTISEIRYTDIVEVVVFLEKERIQFFEAQLTDLTNGQVLIEYLEEKWIKLDNQGNVIEI